MIKILFFIEIEDRTLVEVKTGVEDYKSGAKTSKLSQEEAVSEDYEAHRARIVLYMGGLAHTHAQCHLAYS